MSKRERTTEQKPQLVPVAVLSITFLPPTNQIMSIQPQFPAQMDAQSVLHILRRAEETLITQLAQAQTAKQDEGK